MGFIWEDKDANGNDVEHYYKESEDGKRYEYMGFVLDEWKGGDV